MVGQRDACINIEVPEALVRKIVKEKIEDMVQPRDIDLNEWLDGVGFHPADTELKQLGHEAVRRLVGQLGTTLWQILPPGRDKSLVFTHLEDALMRANRALALGGGPREPVRVEDLRAMMAAEPEDARLEAYKAEQRGETPEVADAQPHEKLGWPTTDSSDRKVIVGTAGSSWVLEVDAEHGKVTIGTMCLDPNTVADVCQEFLAGHDVDHLGPFKGFYVQAETPEKLNEVLQALADAGHHAFGFGDVAPL